MENEALVYDALTTALTGRTAIVIAHRLSTVRSADRIIVLDNAVIAEQGTHDELVTADGLYASQLRAGELLSATE
jgi:ATP-binding cassette subfamily B protein